MSLSIYMYVCVCVWCTDWSGTCTTGIRAVHYHAIEELLRGKARAAAGAFPVFISLWVVASSAGVADFPLDGWPLTLVSHDYFLGGTLFLLLLPLHYSFSILSDSFLLKCNIYQTTAKLFSLYCFQSYTIQRYCDRTAFSVRKIRNRR